MVLRGCSTAASEEEQAFGARYPRRAPELAHRDTVCSPGTIRDSILLILHAYALPAVAY